MSYKIPLLIPSVPSFEVIAKYLRRIDASKRYSNFGPLETELRSRLAEMWKVPSENIVTACNATLALQGAIETSEPNNYSWKVPSWTFVATALAIQKSGKTYDFVDVDLQTWRAVFSEDDENLVDVLPFGDDLDFSRLRTRPLANLVIDAAASFASLSQPLPGSNHRYAIVISLHATKLLPAGEGAIFVTNCVDWAKEFRAWTNFGFSTNRKPSLLGTNAKLSEYAAAVALASLDDFTSNIRQLERIQKQAKEASDSLNLSTHPSMAKGLVSPYWIIKFRDLEQKNNAKNALDLNGIESRNWWESGCHLEQLFGKSEIHLPITDLVAAQTLGLPMHLNLTPRDFNTIVDSISPFC